LGPLQLQMAPSTNVPFDAADAVLDPLAPVLVEVVELVALEQPVTASAAAVIAASRSRLCPDLR
jgi:hypothetical protein